MQTYINPSGQPVARAGVLADNGDIYDVLSAFSEEASAGIPFGVGVKKGTEDRGVKLLTATSETVTGITVYSYNHSPGATTGDLDSSGDLKPKAAIDLLNKGRVYVYVEEAVSAGDRGYCRAVANGAGKTVIGGWRKSQDLDGGSANTCIDLTKLTRFKTSASAGSLAVLEVDFTVKP